MAGVGWAMIGTNVLLPLGVVARNLPAMCRDEAGVAGKEPEQVEVRRRSQAHLRTRC